MHVHEHIEIVVLYKYVRGLGKMLFKSIKLILGSQV